MTKFPIMRVRVTLPTRIVAEMNALANTDHRTFDEVVAAAILVLSETQRIERDVAYARTRIDDGEGDAR